MSSGWTLVLGILLPTCIGIVAGRAKDRGWEGFALGLLLSWVGVLIVLVLSRGGWSCPACREKVKEKAKVCRHCGSRLELIGKGRRAVLRATRPS